MSDGADGDGRDTKMESKGLVAKVSEWPVSAKHYVEDLHSEMRRVTWPSWKQVRATTGVVIVAVFAFAAYFYAVDFLVGRAITRVFTALSR